MSDNTQKKKFQFTPITLRSHVTFKKIIGCAESPETRRKQLNTTSLVLRFYVITLLVALLSTHIGNVKIAYGDEAPIFTNALTANGTKSKAAERLPAVYHFESSNPKEFWAVDLSGTSCENLKGVIYGIRKGNQKQFEEWRKAKPQFNGNFFCFPHVENIVKYLNSGEVKYVELRKVVFKNGPILIHYKKPDINPSPPNNTNKTGLSTKADWISGRYREVTKIYPCSQKKNEFCAQVVSYSYLIHSDNPRYVPSKETGEYRIFCWKCQNLNSSPVDLQKAILFSGGLFGESGGEFALNGGFMIPEKIFKVRLDAPEAEKETKKRNLEYYRSLLLFAGEQ